jgi:hypothetical protein
MDGAAGEEINVRFENAHLQPLALDVVADGVEGRAQARLGAVTGAMTISPFDGMAPPLRYASASGSIFPNLFQLKIRSPR